MNKENRIGFKALRWDLKIVYLWVWISLIVFLIKAIQILMNV